MNERLIKSEPHLIHGTADGYQNHGCRCVPCTKANTDKHREWIYRYQDATLGECEVEGCMNGLYALGRCKPHYERRRRGRPDYPLPRKNHSSGRYPTKDRVV